MEPADGMAFIGRNPMDKPNVYVVTGDSGNGMTHGIVAGLLLSDLIQDRPNEWASLYDPGRVIMRTAADFVKENLNVAAQYAKGYLGTGVIMRTTADFVKENLNVAAQYAKGYLGTGEREGADEIGPDEGAVIRRGVKKVAIFRDESGGLHELSAVCPHLGCIVAWNNVEKTWDCPCHGSRFDKIGRVINGPANTDLERIKEAVHPDQ
jgi:nitrite reductase/ring-hydroxylating ferredoxin subunit